MKRRIMEAKSNIRAQQAEKQRRHRANKMETARARENGKDQEHDRETVQGREKEKKLSSM